MALQIIDEDNFTLSAAKTKDLLTTWGIAETINNNWSGVNELVKYNALGAVKLLVASGALSASQQELEFDIDVGDLGGSQSAAWSRYEEHVLIWLRTINKASALENARKKVRDDICNDFLRKAPSYPSEVGQKSAEFSYEIQHYGETQKGNDLYLFAVWGCIHMQDTKMGEQLYRSRVWGAPEVTIRCVKFSKQMMNKWNSLCSTSDGLADCKAAADNATKASIKDIGAGLRSISFC